jgi:hypothetical protein
VTPDGGIHDGHDLPSTFITTKLLEFNAIAGKDWPTSAPH